LFDGSVENLDMRIRSRLTQARHAALEAAAPNNRFRSRRVWWAPAAGVTAAAVLGAVLWMGPLGHHTVSLPDAQSNLEDLDIVASSDGSGDALEMLQEDLDFYDFADKAANPEPAA
jgi:ferric-dicitrate binding protein FerR (iron transport regulator)